MASSAQSSRGEGSTAAVTWMATVVAVVVIAQQIASKAVRDGLFLTEYDVTVLPYAVVGGAAISFVTAIVLGRLMTGFSPAVAVPVIFGINALVFFGEAVFAQEVPHVVAAVLYLHTAAFGGAVASGFWSVINERFDPYTARRVMGRIAGGATVGGMLGGALTWVFADLPIFILLIILGVANLACGVAIVRVGRGSAHKTPRRAGTPLLDGFRVIGKHSYPRAIAGLVFFVALMTAAIDYVFKAGVTATTSQGDLVGFFAMFYTGTGIVTFVVQALGSQRALKRLGVVATVGVFPVATAVLLLLALFVPSLWTLIALRGAGMVVENSLYRSGYELFYTAVPPEQKRSAKILIDLGCDRLGTAAGSGLALAAIAAIAASSNELLLVGALVFAGAVVGLLVLIRREYVASLARQIRSSLSPAGPQTASLAALAGTFVGSGGDLVWDAQGAEGATGEGGSLSTLGIDREELLAQVKERAAVKAARDETSPIASAPMVSTVSEELLATPLRKLLRTVAEDGSTTEGWSELRRSAPGAIGQLTDVLLSGREGVVVRVRAAELLSNVPGERTVSGLMQALSAAEFRVRRAATLALLRVTQKAPNLRPRMRDLAELASKELRRPTRPIALETEFELSSPFRTDARGNTLASSLELVLLLLAVGGEAQNLRLALSAVTSKDPSQRGTGLEYLDNLLPGNLRSRILGLVENPEATQATQGVSRDVVEALSRELRDGVIDLSELRGRYQSAKQEQYDRDA